MKNITEYEEELLKDFSINPMTDFKEYSLRLGGLRVKWAKYLYDEEENQNQLEDIRSDLYLKKYRHYMYEEKVEKKEVETFINGDEDYRKVLKAIRNIESKHKYIESALKTIDNQSFILNTLIKYLAWNSGSVAQ